MASIRFPKRRDDGSFTVRAEFTTANPDARVVALVSDYVSAWSRIHRTWVRLLRSDVISEERLALGDEFARDPYVQRATDGGRFWVVFDGKPTAKRWKDWTVYLVDELTKVFPEIKFVRFESVD